MELTQLNGSIVGVVTDVIPKEDFGDLVVENVIFKKVDEALKMVNVDLSLKKRKFKELSLKEKNKVLLASKLNNPVIVLYNFTKGLTGKDKLFFKNLFRKINSYGKKIVIVGNDVDFLMNLVDNIYVINKNKLVYQTRDFYDMNLYHYIDMPRIVDFVSKLKNKGVNIDSYTELNELLKAIYRLKS